MNAKGTVERREVENVKRRDRADANVQLLQIHRSVEDAGHDACDSVV